jgi:hypothetical protein
MTNATQRKPIAGENRSSAMDLMLAMGSTKGFDPIPPDQYTTYQDARYSPEIRLWAWLLAQTIRQGRRSRYAVDDRGGELTLKHAAKELKMDPGNLRRAWRYLEQEGRAHVEGRLLCLDGDVKLGSTEGAKEKRSEVCTDLFPPYILKQFNKLTPDRQALLLTRYNEHRRTESKLLAEAVAGVRSIFEQRENIIFSEFGIKKIRDQKRRESESALIPLLLPLVDGFVQTSQKPRDGESVQTSKPPSYKGQIASVPTPLPYIQRTETENSSSSTAAAAATSPTLRHKRNGQTFPLTLAKAREYFPTVDLPFLDKIVGIATPLRPDITDAELASCVVKKTGQTSEGLFLKTVGPRVQALNEHETRRDEATEIAQLRSDAMHAEAIESTRRLLNDPKLPADHRAMLLRHLPAELEKEFAGR